jgi:hypothetical protein
MKRPTVLLTLLLALLLFWPVLVVVLSLNSQGVLMDGQIDIFWFHPL